jgi:hypothetical protein
MSRVRAALVVLALVLVTVCLFGFALRLYAEYEHRRWFSEVRGLLTQLRQHPPGNLNNAEWQDIVDRTLNLHANCAGARADISDQRVKEEFLRALRERSKGEIDGKTIVWIWGQYAEFTRTGSPYQSQYLPLSQDGMQWRAWGDTRP